MGKGGLLVPFKVALDGETLLLGGPKLAFDRIVVAAGPWLPRLLSALIGNKVKPTRQQIMFLSVSPGPGPIISAAGRSNTRISYSRAVREFPHLTIGVEWRRSVS